jgi:hypothetical protein
MTDRKDSLVELLAKVEAGNFKWNAWADPPLDRALMGKVEDSYYGSLDAAKALHEAVLQGWAWSLYEEDSGEFLSIVSKGYNVKIYEEEWHTDPARAWLIAILKALIAGENTNDNDKGED